MVLRVAETGPERCAVGSWTAAACRYDMLTRNRAGRVTLCPVRSSLTLASKKIIDCLVINLMSDMESRDCANTDVGIGIDRSNEIAATLEYHCTYTKENSTSII